MFRPRFEPGAFVVREAARNVWCLMQKGPGSHPDPDTFSRSWEIATRIHFL